MRHKRDLNIIAVRLDDDVKMQRATFKHKIQHTKYIRNHVAILNL